MLRAVLPRGDRLWRDALGVLAVLWVFATAANPALLAGVNLPLIGLALGVLVAAYAVRAR